MVKNTIRGINFKEITSKIKTFGRDKGFNKKTLFIFYNNIGFDLFSILTNPRKIVSLLLSLRRSCPKIAALPLKKMQITVKNNLRLFCFDKKTTVKIGLCSDSRKGSLWREIKARKFYPDLTPSLLDYDKKSFVWLEETLIKNDENTHREEREKLFLDKYAEGLYKPFSRSKPFAFFLRKNNVKIEDINNFLKGSQLNLTVAEDILLAASMVHGDISSANMLYDKEHKFYLIDFELMHIGIIAVDLIKIFKANEAKVINIIDNCSSEGACEGTLQMILGIALKAVVFDTNYDKTKKYYMDHLRYSETEAEKTIKKTKDNYLKLIREIKEGVF